MGFAVVLVIILLFNSFLDTGISLDGKLVDLLYVQEDGDKQEEKVVETVKKTTPSRKKSTQTTASTGTATGAGTEDFTDAVTDKASAEDLLEAIYGGDK